jgi:hypothetical protein
MNEVSEAFKSIIFTHVNEEHSWEVAHVNLVIHVGFENEEGSDDSMKRVWV